MAVSMGANRPDRSTRRSVLLEWVITLLVMASSRIKRSAARPLHLKDDRIWAHPTASFDFFSGDYLAPAACSDSIADTVAQTSSASTSRMQHWPCGSRVQCTCWHGASR